MLFTIQFIFYNISFKMTICGAGSGWYLEVHRYMSVPCRGVEWSGVLLITMIQLPCDECKMTRTLVLMVELVTTATTSSQTRLTRDTAPLSPSTVEQHVRTNIWDLGLFERQPLPLYLLPIYFWDSNHYTFCTEETNYRTILALDDLVGFVNISNYHFFFIIKYH